MKFSSVLAVFVNLQVSENLEMRFTYCNNPQPSARSYKLAGSCFYSLNKYSNFNVNI